MKSILIVNDYNDILEILSQILLPYENYDKTQVMTRD
jgi:hypothetical protein